jgi:hypothetical protein
MADPDWLTQARKEGRILSERQVGASPPLAHPLVRFRSRYGGQSGKVAISTIAVLEQPSPGRLTEQTPFPRWCNLPVTDS